ncbi:leucine-rich repeat and WD repeat-containing protein 1 isoform X2 [Petaurus breviceps papuanus]|uniref:leucine-rich repeat and WD repeat-containing protein 1 isoform X2 n=1 Tax=Petaurus breviceps papuanus TaxID=3040969 RepID=UPI0036DCD6FB
MRRRGPHGPLGEVVPRGQDTWDPARPGPLPAGAARTSQQRLRPLLRAPASPPAPVPGELVEPAPGGGRRGRAGPRGGEAGRAHGRPAAMGRLKTPLLLQRGHPKSDRLGRIKKLDLSNLQLRTKDLDLKLLNRMKQLKELDLSDNLLEKVPEGLELPCLQVLKCSNNQLEDVTPLQQFPALEEVDFEDNLYLTVNDNYKISSLLPNIRKINGKETASLMNHVKILNRELTSRVTAYWEKNYQDQLGSPALSRNFHKEFVKNAVKDVRYGPESLSDFTQWKVKMIAQQLVASKLTRKEEPSEEGSKEDDPSPETPVTPEGTPRTPATLEGASSQEYVLKLSAFKWKKRLPSDPPPCKRARPSTPLQESQPVPKEASLSSQSGSPSCGQSALAEGPEGEMDTGGQEPMELQPMHFLQCHSKGNSPDDFSTQLWACAFEPTWTERPGLPVGTSQTVATCGGEAVCVIDCQTGLVLHRYKVPGEEFFTVAWTCLTLVTQDGRKKRSSVLAAAGRRGVVSLIHVRAGFCYGDIRAHRKPIAMACFSPSQETHLFTASYNKRIILWDIGLPDYNYHFRSSQLLMLDTSATPLRLCPVPSCPDHYLLAGCEDGCFAWDIRLNESQKRRDFEMVFLFPQGPGRVHKRVDGLGFVSEDIVASKGCTPGSICLWSWSRSLAERGGKQQVTAVILAELQWSNTELSYLTLSTCPEKAFVFCGDEEGSVWMYNVRHHLEQQQPLQAKVAPTKILKWPDLSARGQKMNKTLINTAVADPTFTYLVALTDTNIIAIWKKL